MDINWIIILLCSLVVLSYLFDLLARRFRVPSVLLLLGAGLALNYVARALHLRVDFTGHLLSLFGMVGLILIVLEAALELRLERGKLRLVAEALYAAALVFVFSSLLLTLLIQQLFRAGLLLSLVHAIPLAVISSAVAIPSVATLSGAKREFIIYESIFSDIIGILAFNLVIQDGFLQGGFFFLALLDLIYVVILSVGFSLGLILLIDRIRHHLKFFFILAVLILVYTLGKHFHLPTLLLVLVFGLFLGNLPLWAGGRLARWVSRRRLGREIRLMDLIVKESAFVVRTFFFVLFGFSFDPAGLLRRETLLAGGAILGVLILTRLIYLRLVAKMDLIPELFIAPRGLITILLFYSIPPSLRIERFSESILFLVVLATGLFMMMGLLLARDQEQLVVSANE